MWLLSVIDIVLMPNCLLRGKNMIITPQNRDVKEGQTVKVFHCIFSAVFTVLLTPASSK